MGSSLKLKWISEHFHHLPHDASDETVHHYARAYILWLIGGVLVPDKSQNIVKMMFLPLLRDFDRIQEYSWGGATLACLYRMLCRATKADTKEIAGPLVLLQVWAWRFDRMVEGEGLVRREGVAACLVAGYWLLVACCFFILVAADCVLLLLPADSVQEHLRKVHNPNTEGTIQSETDSKKPKYGLEKVLRFSDQNTAEENISDSGEKIKKGTTVTVSKLPDIEATLEPPVVIEANDLLCDDQTAIESQPPENSGKHEGIPVTNGELRSREDITDNESQKSARTASSVAKQERAKNGVQNRPAVPSYIAATESAKAKLKEQGSLRDQYIRVEKVETKVIDLCCHLEMEMVRNGRTPTNLLKSKNSKLTHMLQSSLGGDCKTLMFVQINPSAVDLGETLCSLNFASRVRGIEHGPACKQADLTELVKYKQLAEKAKHDEKEMKKLQDSLQSLQLRLGSTEHFCRSLQEKNQLAEERKTRLKQETRALAAVSAQSPALSALNQAQKTIAEKKPPLGPSRLRLPLRRITNFLPPPSPHHKTSTPTSSILPVSTDDKENISNTTKTKAPLKARRGSIAVRPRPPATNPDLTNANCRICLRYQTGEGCKFRVVLSTLAFTAFELPPNEAIGTRILEFLFHSRPDLVNIRSVDEAIVIGAALSLSSSAFVLQNLVEESIWPMLAKESLKALRGLGLHYVDLKISKVMSSYDMHILNQIYESHVVAEARSSEDFVALCLLTLGTFLAGALLAKTNFRTQIEADIRPFRGLLLGLFFVTTGTSIDMQKMDCQVSERALILSVYADGLSSHVTWCTDALHLPKAVHNQLYKQLKGGSGSCRGGRNLQRGDSSRRGGGRGSDDAEDETPFALLNASCAYHDKFGKRHFVMPKYYRDPCGLVEDPSDNQIGYGLANARLLKWPVLFIERVQMERLCRENRLKVPKARSVEIQKEDPDNVDRLCERLQREISQMGRRLARDMQLHIVKKDPQKNRTEPNVAAIKGIMEDPELVSDAELSDCLDSEPPADLSAN
ncbi:unnamed protein product [Camellia sinensis]